VSSRDLVRRRCAEIACEIDSRAAVRASAAASRPVPHAARPHSEVNDERAPTQTTSEADVERAARLVAMRTREGGAARTREYPRALAGSA